MTINLICLGNVYHLEMYHFYLFYMYTYHTSIIRRQTSGFFIYRNFAQYWLLYHRYVSITFESHFRLHFVLHFLYYFCITLHFLLLWYYIFYIHVLRIPSMCLCFFLNKTSPTHQGLEVQNPCPGAQLQLKMSTFMYAYRLLVYFQLLCVLHPYTRLPSYWLIGYG